MNKFSMQLVSRSVELVARVKAWEAKNNMDLAEAIEIAEACERHGADIRKMKGERSFVAIAQLVEGAALELRRRERAALNRMLGIEGEAT